MWSPEGNGDTRRSGSKDPLFLWHEPNRSTLKTTLATGIEKQVEDLLAQELPEVDLRAATARGREGSAVLTVFIDHPDGVDHELCVKVTRALEGAGIRDLYAVEVSSPGPEPPLRVTRHFLAAVGGQVKLLVKPGTLPAGAKSVSGTLTGVTEESLTVESSAGVVVVPRDAVRGARMVKVQCGDDGRSLK